MKAIADAKPAISAAAKQLEKLVEVETSMERASLLGSAYKRLALIAEIEGDAATEKTEIESMKRYYEQAERIGRDNKIAGLRAQPPIRRISIPVPRAYPRIGQES